MSKWYYKEMSLWYNIKNIFFGLIWPFEKIIRKTIKIIQYIPILWHDEDWDYSYFLELMKYKIGRMRKCIVKHNLILKAEEVAAEMKHVEDLIQKYLDHDFCRDLHEAHEKKWGEVRDLSEPIEVDGQTMYTWDISREKATSPELKQQEKDEQHAIYIKQNKEEQKTLDDIFSCLRLYLERWWD